MPYYTRPALLLAALLAALPAHAQQGTGIAQRARACLACHGKDGQAGSANFFPRIAGKPSGYLYSQLLNFRDGRRRYPAMNTMVAHLSDDYLRELADYFSQLHPAYPAPSPPPASPIAMARGRQLVMQGNPAAKVPACISCHGQRLTGVQPAIPGLLGLPRDYLNAQFGAWKSGARQAAAPDCMRQISERLSPDDVSAVTAWLASQAPAADMAAAASLPDTLPVSCGSVPK
jgi:cytochrome c553